MNILLVEWGDHLKNCEEIPKMTLDIRESLADMVHISKRNHWIININMYYKY